MQSQSLMLSVYKASLSLILEPDHSYKNLSTKKHAFWSTWYEWAFGQMQGQMASTDDGLLSQGA